MIDYISLDFQHSMDARLRLLAQETSTAAQCICSVCAVGKLNGGDYNHQKVTRLEDLVSLRSQLLFRSDLSATAIALAGGALALSAALQQTEVTWRS